MRGPLQKHPKDKLREDALMRTLQVHVERCAQAGGGKFRRIGGTLPMRVFLRPIGKRFFPWRGFRGDQGGRHRIL
ncbi:hypothetical protein TRIP_B40196 [uncultured Desulfatiglans sp.]|nr:hypothetical protein TRIP_B40196 [uncultured Desulfatiglans sp.]